MKASINGLTPQAEAASRAGGCTFDWGAGVMCTHYACRCARAAELADMADAKGDSRLLLQAIGVHSQEVKCRQQVVPRDDSSGGRDFEEMRK